MKLTCFVFINFICISRINYHISIAVNFLNDFMYNTPYNQYFSLQVKSFRRKSNIGANSPQFPRHAASFSRVIRKNCG